MPHSTYPTDDLGPALRANADYLSQQYKSRMADVNDPAEAGEACAATPEGQALGNRLFDALGFDRPDTYECRLVANLIGALQRRVEIREIQAKTQKHKEN